MKKVLSIEEAIKISEQLRNEGKTVVVAGGCFDILHLGHIHFIEHAKKEGDVLFLLLESDEAIKKQKGANRPINSQQTRSHILAALSHVDFVVLLPMLENNEYDDIISRLKPNVIATTQHDEYRFHKERQAKLVGAKVLDVIPRLVDQSTSRIAKLLAREL